MWYFAWALGVGFASALAILNVLWLESTRCLDDENCDGGNKEETF